MRIAHTCVRRHNSAADRNRNSPQRTVRTQRATRPTAQIKKYRQPSPTAINLGPASFFCSLSSTTRNHTSTRNSNQVDCRATQQDATFITVLVCGRPTLVASHEPKINVREAGWVVVVQRLVLGVYVSKQFGAIVLGFSTSSEHTPRTGGWKHRGCMASTRRTNNRPAPPS